VEFSDTFVTLAAGRALRRPLASRIVVAALVAALLTPLAAIATVAPAGAATASAPATGATTTSTAAPASTWTTSTTAPTAAATATDPAAASATDGLNTISYAGAPWFKPGVAYNANFPDPTVVWDGTKYWAYATSTGGSLMPAMSSTDLKTWIPRPAYSPNPYNGDPFFNDSFPVPPAWTTGGTSRVGKAQWAPGVVKLGSFWVAYTSWEVAPGRRCISVARATSPAGPFVDLSGQPFQCDSDPGGSIDPQPFVDTDGQVYLQWKSSGVPGSAPTKIKSRLLSPDGLSFAPGSSATAILQTELPWDGNSIENPSMVKYGGVYWLIYSGNEWESANYRMGQAACAGPLGPCSRTSSSPLIENTATEWSPGGGTLFTDTTGRLRIIYQVWNAPYTSYPSDPNCDGPGLCASQGQRSYRIDGVANAGGRLTVDPIGSLDQVTLSTGAVTVGGWALDPSDPSSIAVHVYVDNVGTAITANGSRPDVGALFPGLGSAHGFAATVAAPAGTHTLCVYGINKGAGGNVAIRCRSIAVPGTSPFGSFDSIQSRPGSVTVGGWAVDPDTANPIDVHVYVDNVGSAFTAGLSRPDIGALYPASGANHGFSATVAATRGLHNLSVYGINVASGSNVLLGCRLALVPGGSPFGSLDGASGVPGGVSVGGWAIDPDVTAPIDVHVYVDDKAVATIANRVRSDVGSVYPQYGSAHGYATTAPASAGLHTVCAYGINVGLGGNSLLGCRSVVVPDTSPFGSLDSVVAMTGAVFVGGWAIDPDTTAPIAVHVYIDSTITGLNADQSRSDIGTAYPAFGPTHGFGSTISTTAGVHTVCAYAINVAGGSNRPLGCRTVTVR
jgi:hypothetical protein